MLWFSLAVLLLVNVHLWALGTPETGQSTGGGGTQLVTMLVTWGLIKIGLAFIPQGIAGRKGRKRGRWWVYGFFLFWPALIHSLVIHAPTKKCPYCSETIQVEAKFCRFCGKEVGAIKAPQQTVTASTSKKCPYCAEDIKMDAKVCRYCGRDLLSAPTS
jgi:RNA polymerase subunit RPABC4/transcription elongation factor Spt4